MWRYIAHDDRTSRHCRVVPDGHARTNRYACADPCVRFNGDREKLKVIVILARVIDRDEIRPRGMCQSF